jgi:hypothetical protein
MIENIRAEFKIMLDQNTWMDRESKRPAEEKANKNIKTDHSY